MKWGNVAGEVFTSLELSEKGAVRRSRGMRNHNTAMEVIGQNPQGERRLSDRRGAPRKLRV